MLIEGASGVADWASTAVDDRRKVPNTGLRRKTGARLARLMGRPAIELRAQHVERRGPQGRRAARWPLAGPPQKPCRLYGPDRSSGPEFRTRPVQNSALFGVRRQLPRAVAAAARARSRRRRAAGLSGPGGPDHAPPGAARAGGGPEPAPLVSPRRVPRVPAAGPADPVRFLPGV